jgi:hypothetical protein
MREDRAYERQEGYPARLPADASAVLLQEVSDHQSGYEIASRADYIEDVFNFHANKWLRVPNQSLGSFIARQNQQASECQESFLHFFRIFFIDYAAKA